MRPGRSTCVASMMTSPAPEFASMPRCETCQSLATPSSALYWHMGETTMRLSSARSASRNGENKAEAMGAVFPTVKWEERAERRDGLRPTRRTACAQARASGKPSAEPHHRERQRLRARNDRVDLEILVGRVGAAADRADAADGRGADARGKARIGAAAGELLAHVLPEVARASRVERVEALRLLAGDQRLELAGDLEFCARAGQMAVRHDALDLGHAGAAVGRMDIAEIKRRGSARRHHVDDLAARDRADIVGDAALAVGEPVQLDDLAGDLLDRADAVGAVVAGVRRLAGHVEPHEDAALAAGDDAAVRPPRLRVEHRAGTPRLLLDQGFRRRRTDLLVGGEQADQR